MCSFSTCNLDDAAYLFETEELATMPKLSDFVVEECAEGVHRLGTTYVGFYVLEEGGRYTLIDSGLPGYWDSLVEFLASRNATIADIEAQVLTHHHIDHRGNTERIRVETGSDVRIHHLDAPFLVDEPPPPKAPIWKPAVLKYFLHLVKHKALKTPSVTQVTNYEDGEVLDVPGRPRVVHVPGHTPGHSSMYLASQKAVVTGDALGGMDAFTGEIGPRLSPAFVNDDNDMALESLSRLEDLDADKVLVVHGPTWNGPIAEAIAIARAAAGG